MLAMVPVELSIFFSNFFDLDLAAAFTIQIFQNLLTSLQEICVDMLQKFVKKFPAIIFDVTFVMSKW